MSLNVSIIKYKLSNITLMLSAIGAHRERETPVPIPNTAVKPPIGYYTWPIKAWENSTVPNYKKDLLQRGSFFNPSEPCYFPKNKYEIGAPEHLCLGWLAQNLRYGY